MPRKFPIAVAQIIFDYMTDEQLFNLLNDDQTASTSSQPKSPYDIELQTRILFKLFSLRSKSALDYQKRLVKAWPRTMDNNAEKIALLRFLEKALKEPLNSYEYKLHRTSA